MAAIQVEHMKKYFKIYQKEAGFLGAIKALYSRKYFDSKAVEDISFSIEEGELVGFIGPNGAGKTTTLKCLSGLLYPSSGTVSVLGFTPFERKNEFLRKVSLVMGQKNQLWWDLPPIDSFLLNKEIYRVPEAQYKKTIDELTELLDVKDVLKVQVRKLSLGQRMKCELIAALIHSPKVLFLDEPTIGLDVVMQQNLRSFIKDYNKKFNSTIILTSHYMQDVKELCERVIVIDHGKILYDGKLDAIIKKYATYKSINLIFNKKVSHDDLKIFGKVELFEFPKATITVPFETSNTIASAMLQKLPIDDITIEEPDIEDIVRQVFSGA